VKKGPCKFLCAHFQNFLEALIHVF